MTKKTINVNYLARVEGEGSLMVDIEDKKVKEVQLKIFEPPRFFESLLRGRQYTEAPDITARICGICPVAYLMSASQAMESVCGVPMNDTIRKMRRLIYCGEWIKSHCLHIYMLHLPDFLGFADAVAMAKKHPEFVQNGLRLKKIGNEIMTLLGGRDIHPINVKVGGFYKMPEKAGFDALKDELNWGLKNSIESLDFLKKLNFPDFEPDYELVAMAHDKEYPFNEGRLKSNKGLDVDISKIDEVITEKQVKHSNALHAYLADKGPCLAGPMARFHLNYDQLTPKAKKAAESVGLKPNHTNPFKSILTRTIEVIFAFEEALNLIEDIDFNAPVSIEVPPKAGTGYGCTEAPRGICYHRYKINDQGEIEDAKIISPTTINQMMIEKDLYHFIEQNIEMEDAPLRDLCETVIRNYDPCISCSTHFLDLKVSRQ